MVDGHIGIVSRDFADKLCVLQLLHGRSELLPGGGACENPIVGVVPFPQKDLAHAQREGVDKSFGGGKARGAFGADMGRLSLSQPLTRQAPELFRVPYGLLYARLLQGVPFATSTFGGSGLDKTFLLYPFYTAVYMD